MIDIQGDSLSVILGAVPFETDALVDLLDRARSFAFLDGTFHRGLYGDRAVIIGSTGLGKVNAAITTSALLERFPVEMVWNAGCAGAFREGPLGVGDVLVTLNAICGDEGVLTRDRILPSTHIGIPVLTDGKEKYFDHIPLSRPSRQLVLEKIMRLTPEGLYRQTGSDRFAAQSCPEEVRECGGIPSLEATHGTAAPGEIPAHPPDCAASEDNPSAIFRLRYGPGLTVGMVSGDIEVARNRFLRYGAYAENMEGSAVAQACFRFGVPMVECRGISNMAGNRNKTDWHLEDAISHCHGIILNWLRGLA